MGHIRNSLRQFKKRLYSLKRRYGYKADLYHITTEMQDPTTGRKILNRIKYKIKRVILLPVLLQRELQLSGQWARTTQGFPPGGFDVSERVLLIDNHDLPNDYEIKVDDYLVIDHERYDIKSTNTLEDNVATLIKAKHLKGGQPNEIHDLNFKQKIDFTQSGGADII